MIFVDEFIMENIPSNGNKFLCGNGYFGMRGTLEEFTKENMPAINMAGTYDRVGEKWRESVNAPHPLYTLTKVDGAEMSVLTNKPQKHHQEIDFYNGIHKRETVWNTEKGQVTVIAERFASMVNQHVIGMKYTVRPTYSCKIDIATGIDGDVWDINGPHFASVECSQSNGVKTVVGTTGENATKVKTEERVIADFVCESQYEITDKKAVEHLIFNAEANKEYSFVKIAAVSTSRDDIIFKVNADSDVTKMDYETLKSEHIAAWNKIWDISKVNISGDADAEQALNYSIYHLNCIAPRNMNSMSIAARGLSGQVYKGAIFWDTEMFMVDYFLFTEPEITKTILKYRIDTLGGAKKKAAEYGHNGAFYAWESQEDGTDACSEYNVTDVFTKRPMRTFFRDKQVHVSAAVVYALDKYIKVTGDTSILDEGGNDILKECAEFYCSLLIKRFGCDLYEIHDVVGPDEYHERVNNNAYTNAMAKFALQSAAEYLNEEKYAEVADQIYIPEPNENGIIEQFEGYFKMEDCSIADVKSRLLDPTEYWGGAYGVAADTQILKQADVVAMLSMLPEGYTKQEMHDNLKYYEPRTEHGSSLSACMYSLLSCKIDEPEFAYPLFMKSASADLVPGVKEWIGPQYIGGTHPAAAGGAWKVAIFGFAGMTAEENRLYCNPNLPQKWDSMEFKINYRDRVYQVKIGKENWSISEL